MKCLHCHATNPDWRAYCFKCGAELGMVCANCQFSNREQDRFCGGCGIKLGEQSPVSGRAQLTIDQLAHLVKQSRKLMQKETKLTQNEIDRFFEKKASS